jgi:hypothetical protein
MNYGKAALQIVSTLSNYHTEDAHWDCVLGTGTEDFAKFQLGLSLESGLQVEANPAVSRRHEHIDTWVVFGSVNR